jgi:ribonuclease R
MRSPAITAKPVVTTTPATTTTTTTTTTTAAPVTVTPPVPKVIDDFRAATTPRVSGGGDLVMPMTHVAPAPSSAALDQAGLVANQLKNHPDANTASLFARAGDANERVRKAVSIDIPMQMQVVTAKAKRLPGEIPGMLKATGKTLTFYPADEQLKPFTIDASQGQHLRTGVVLLARVGKTTVDVTTPDGVTAAPIYRLDNHQPGGARSHFIGVVDLVAGQPFIRDAQPPPRFVPLPALASDGKPWAEGAILEVKYDKSKPNGEAITVMSTMAAAGTAEARTWRIAGDQRLDALFTPRALMEADALAAAQPASLQDAGLVDWTNKPFFAIDNPGSQDIDQAMWLERRADGGFLMHYALADAAHYVKPGTALWETSSQRGASFYLPGMSVPMMPRNLCEGVVSLNAGEDHRAVVMTISMDAQGKVDAPTSFVRAKIHSQAQLTYAGVTAHLQHGQAIDADDHGTAVSPAIRDQLKLFEGIGKVRMEQASARGVVEPQRREMEIARVGNRFELKEEHAEYASALNAELSILANVEGARALTTSSIKDLWVPGIFRTHAAPEAGTLRALEQQVEAFVSHHQLPNTWQWQRGSESMSTWVERLKVVPNNDRERALSVVLQSTTLSIYQASSYERTAGLHSGLQLDAYGRFTAPMRELVGIVSHAILTSKNVLEEVATTAKLNDKEAHALWGLLLMGAVLPPEQIPADKRAAAAQAQQLLSLPSDQRSSLARSLVKDAAPMSDGERKLVDDAMNRAMNAGNHSRQVQRQVEGASRKLLFDDLFLADLGGNAAGSAQAPVRRGVINSVTPTRISIQLSDPDVEVRLGADDLKLTHPDQSFQLGDEGCSLEGVGATKPVRWFIGDAISIKASHHDGDKLHFVVAEEN